MKKKLFTVLCFTILLFVCACSKKEDQTPDPTQAVTLTPSPTATPSPSPTPTPSPTPSPTPLPENLALTKLNNLSTLFDFFSAYQPDNTVDYSKGIGYDITASLSANQMLIQQLNLGELPSFKMKGSFDFKDYLAGQCIVSLDDNELATIRLFTDYTTLLFNLPKYSSVYAACNLQEITNSSSEKGIDWEELEGDSVTGIFSKTNLMRTNTTINSANISTNANLTKLLNTYLKRFLECFKAEDGITKNLTIGTGAYTLTGEKHTVFASHIDLQKVIDTMENDPQTPANLKESLMELTLDETNYVYLSYYTDGADSYAWELSFTDKPEESMIFISAPAGFCLYIKTSEDSDRIIFSSVTTSKGAGTITIPTNNPETADSTIKYLIGEKSISLDANLQQTFRAVLDYSIVNDVVKYSLSITASGISFSIQQTGTAKHLDYELKIALYGLELITLDMTTDLRDYCEIPLPKDSVDLDTWNTRIDIESLASDLLVALEPYPLLKDMILDIGTEEDVTDPDAENRTPSTGNEASDSGIPRLPDSSYTDAFMTMTGYTINEDGSVDFEPQENEVLSRNEASTGFFLLPLPDATKTDLLYYASHLYADPYEDLYSYYNISGSTLDDSVMSHYCQCYDYYDSTNFNNSINIAFDAVSGDFIWVYCCHATTEGAVQMANDVLKLLGTDYILTTDIIDHQVLYDVYLIQGERGETYQTVSILIYLPEE